MASENTERDWLDSKVCIVYTTLEKSMALHLRALSVAQAILALSVMAFVLVSAWERWYPYQVIAFWDVEVLNADRAVPASTLWVKIKYDKTMNIPAVSTKVLICGKRKMYLGQEGGSNPMGINQEAIIPVTIPELNQTAWNDIRQEMGGMAMCYIRGNYRYTLPSGREIWRYWESQEFPVQ